MNAIDEPTTIELRRWAFVQASILRNKFDSPVDVLKLAQDIEEWVLRDAADARTA